MRSDWRVTTIGEVAAFENRFRIPLSAEQRADRKGHYPYWGANGPFDMVDDYLFDGARVLVAEDGNTVVRSDGRGTVHWATGRYWVNNHAHVLNVNNGHDLRWLFYALSSARMRDYVTGSAQPKLSMGSLKRVSVLLPPRAEQQRIAWVLGRLDDKIDSNRRLAALLEETAAAIFKAQFVDFVGVEEFEDSDLGRIPRGWSVGVLGDLAEIAKTSIEPFSTPDVRFEHFSIPAFDNGRYADIENGREILSSKTLLPGGDCVLVSKLNPATKRVWLPRPTGEGPAICSPEFIVLVPKQGIPNSYLYALLTADQRFYDELLAHVTGTTGSRQRVKPSAVLACRVLVPDSDALSDRNEVAQFAYEQTLSLLAEERTLAAIRDTLLPKLISGEIRVPDTADPEEVIGPAAELVGAST